MPTPDSMTPAEQVRAITIEDELLDGRVMDSTTAKSYAVTCIERARAYLVQITRMELHPYLTVWASEMEKKHTRATIKVHHNYLPWLSALLVVRYGEAVDQWPSASTEKDLERARRWKHGEQPKVVSV